MIPVPREVLESVKFTLEACIPWFDDDFNGGIYQAIKADLTAIDKILEKNDG